MAGFYVTIFIDCGQGIQLCNEWRHSSLPNIGFTAVITIVQHRIGGALHILFVCTGNICRSPIAERLAVALAEARDIKGFSAASAGTHAVIGHPIHAHAAAVLESLGGDSTNFAARQLRSKIIMRADLTLTMTSAHRDAVLEAAPQKLHSTFTLSEASRLVSVCGARTAAELSLLRPQLSASYRVGVLDPIGHDPEVFVAVGAEIAELLVPIIDLCQRSSG